MSGFRTVVAGALAGLAWGVLARVWMRLISTYPEFTWSGTAFILAAPTIIGMLAGLALVARRRGWRAAGVVRGFGGGSMILLGAGAGAIMLPSLLFGTLAAVRTGWPRWVRALLAVLALGPVAFLLVTELLTEPTGLTGPQVAIMVVGYLGLVGAMILILRVSLAPGAAPAVLPSLRAARAPDACSVSAAAR